MRTRLPLFVVLAATIVSAGGCKRGSGDTDRAPRTRAARVKLPEPLPLPQQPVAAAHIKNPAAALAVVDPWVEESLSPQAVLERGLQQFTTAAAAAQIAPTLDADDTWSSVRLGDGEEIAHFPVLPASLESLASALDGLPKEGRFGARRLPQRPPVDEAEEGPWSHQPDLAWLDRDAGTLTIATSLRGLVTGPRIAETYGTSELFVTADGSMMPEIVPLTRVTVEGTVNDLRVRASLEPGFDPASSIGIEDGALTGLLSASGVVAGGTTRVADHELGVKQLIANIDRMVEEQPFLMQGILQDMQRKFNAVARSWDGRVLAGLGPSGHVRVAFGSDDPKKSGVAVLRFVDTVADNAKLLRNFSSQVPSISMKKNVGDGGGEPIHRLSIGNAKGLLPPEAHALVDDKNKLRIAMAWSRHAGAGMAVVGPDSVAHLERWLETSARAASGEDTLGDLGALVVALDPADAPALRNTELDLGVLFGLDANGPRRTVVGRKLEDGSIQLDVKGVPRRAKKSAGGDASSRP